ncbi:MAG: glutathione S-transferase [Alphaproteobacteria bacterium PA4]|nr:MAG: glutathione S-transferase [Alphaproteobacteria bacterium PA4]
MKFYDSIGPNPRVVRIAMAEQGLSVETLKVDILKGENRQPAYMAMVPSGGTPALVLDNGTVLSEITAIVEYLDEQPGAARIVGNTPEERAETRMWARRIDLYILEPMANGFRASEGRPMFAPRMTLVSPEAAAELKALAQEKLLWLDAQLQGRTWVCGDRYSLADILLLAFVEFGASVGQPLPAAAAWLADWHKRAAARPSSAA